MKKFLILAFFCFSAVFAYSQSSSWKNLNAEGEVLERHENALAHVGNKIVLIGGRGNKPLNILNTNTGEWSEGAQPPFEIHHLQAVTLDGLVYVLGGFTGGWPHETPLSHVLIYDIKEDIWLTGHEIPLNRRRGAAGVAVYNNKIYMVNGIINGHTSGWVNWLDEYDPYTGSWKTLPDAPVARDHFQAVVIKDQLFVAGGRRSGSIENSGFAGTVKETNVFNFKTNEWKELPDIPTPRAGTASTIFHGNPVVLGGESDRQETAHNEVETFDLASGTWKELPPLKKGRHGTQAVLLNNKIIIGAGSGNRGGGPELKSFEIFSTEKDLNLQTEALDHGELIVSAEELLFTENKNIHHFMIKNNSRNKAIPVSYLLTDNPEDFKITISNPTPLIIPPGGQINLQIEAENVKSKDAALFIKPAGESPIEIMLKFN